MAFTEEQEKTILESLAKFGTFIEGQQKAKEPEAKPAEKTVSEEAKEKLNEEKNSSALTAELQSAVKFNYKIDSFIEDRKEALPEEAKKIVETANGKTYSDEIQKANAIRKAILDSFLASQKNIDLLSNSESLKEKALRYKDLTEGDKEKRSAEFWEVVEVGTATKKQIDKAEALKKANGQGAGEGTAFRSRFLALGDKFNKKGS